MKKVGNTMYVIEVYKDNEFIGYANGNWDYSDTTGERFPYTMTSMHPENLPQYTLEEAEEECKGLRDEFVMYDFIIKELK